MLQSYDPLLRHAPGTRSSFPHVPCPQGTGVFFFTAQGDGVEHQNATDVCMSEQVLPAQIPNTLIDVLQRKQLFRVEPPNERDMLLEVTKYPR